MKLHVCLAAALLCAACGDDSGGGGKSDGGGGDGGRIGDGGLPDVACVASLTSITLAPAASTVTRAAGSTAPIAFTATGMFTGMAPAALDPASLVWSVTRDDDTPPGTITAGSFVPNPNAGGTYTVTAANGCAMGMTTIIIQLTSTVGDPNDPAWNGTPVAGTTAKPAPDIVYPTTETRFPRNLFRTLFQWHTAGYSEFRVNFVGPFASATVFTSGVHALCAGKTPAAGCLEADEALWTRIAGSNAGRTATVTVDAIDRSITPAVVRRSAPITIGFSRRDVKGAIFYWSTTSAGIRRGSLANPDPEDYLAPPMVAGGNTVKCVACHVVSRDGKYLAAATDAMPSGQSIWMTQVTLAPPPMPLLTQLAGTGGHSFATISPDDKYFVTAVKGVMAQRDLMTGAIVAMLPVPLAGMTGGGMQPDWSPSNHELFYATGTGDAPNNSSLNAIAYTPPSTWGALRTLVAAGGGSNLFPMASPRGDYVAYSHGKGGHGDVTAQLFVVPSAVGGTPVELINANRMISNKTTTGQFENSQPTWAPEGDLEWIAFNTKREYGVVLKSGLQQIWVAAVDPSKLGGTVDPSFPAFRVPFQGLDENNHRAFWTLDIRDPPPQPDGGVPDAGMCAMAGDPCQPGIVKCCDPSAFVCDSTVEFGPYTCIPAP